MMYREENFYEFAYRIFYKFAEVSPENFGIIFSKNSIYPIFESIHNPYVIIPLPKLVNEKFVYEGMVFDNTPQGRQSLWALFLATLYHIASHAAVSSYQKYQKWTRRKTPEICWQVIDHIEDILADRYLHHKDKEIWQNIIDIEKRILENNKTKTTSSSNDSFPSIYKNNKIASMADDLIKNIGQDGFEKNVLSLATQLYQNRVLIQKPILPFQEHHTRYWSPKTEQPGPALKPVGVFEEQVIQLDDLWEENERIKNNILRRYKKHLKGLNFDAVVIPPGNIQAYERMKSKTLPMLRRIRQQLRLIANLTDDPKIDEIGYIDMQMAIQAIASEGATTEIYERDELRRGEEAWVILMDKSASMSLRFDLLQEFAVTVSESANELTSKSDAWAFYTFDNRFYILKDFKERYGQEIKARIGTIDHGGLSLLPDAIELAGRVLAEDPRERKFIFVITDGHPSGYEKIQEAFSKTVKKTEMAGITLIGIGVTKTITRKFRNNARGTDLKQLAVKFITAYKAASSADV